jgi:nitrite reductase/ring-hydroxylating ferredoxin subunit
MPAAAIAPVAINTFNAVGIGSDARREAELVAGCVKSVAGSIEFPLAAPHPEAFPRHPQSWYAIDTSASLPRGEVRAVRLCERELVVFRGQDGRVGALDARCPHLGANLAGGRIVRDAVECPYHHFRFERDGVCRTQALRSRAYAVEERFGAIFVFLGPQPLFPLPAFEQTDLVSAPPMTWRLNTQWYMVGANAFDARHFNLAHGRRLVGPPIVSSPEPHALDVRYEYAIEGRGWTDRLVRLASGGRVSFHVVAWGGNLLLARARFARDESFGVVSVIPLGARSSEVRVHVSAKRSGTHAGAMLRDWLRVRLKRFAIRNMLKDDARGLRQLDYLHGGLRAGDEALAAFLRWAANMPDNTHQEEVSHER